MAINSTISQQGYDLIEKVAELANNAEYDIEKIVRITLDEIEKMFGFSYARVLKRNGFDYSFSVTYSTEKKKKENQNINLSKETFRSIVKNCKRYVYHNNDEIKKSGVEKNYGFDFKSFLLFPIFYHDYFIGAFEFFNFENEEKYENNELFLIETILKVLMQYMYGMGAFDYIESKGDKIDFISGTPKYEEFAKITSKNMLEKSDDEEYAFVCFDIAQFKYLNDTFGYNRGNAVLHKTAEKIIENEYTETVTRVHSDNFVYTIKLEKNCDEKESILKIVENINRTISKVIGESFNGVKIRFSTGIYIVSDSKFTVDDAYTKANLARKNSKYNENNSICFYNEKMMDSIRRQEELNSKFTDAIKNKNLIVYYQPKISCRNEKAAGGEALIRWRKDGGGFIYPDEFIPLFEKNGNIIELDYYVYKEVFSYIRKRLDEGKKVVPISMNVSRIHLENDDIVKYILKLFDDYKIPPEYVEFELTENIYMNNMANAKKFLDFCKKIGVFVSMDDFGSGYSSLNVMNSLPIDILKLDKVFLRNEKLTDNDMIVIECIVSMAKRLKMKVICEGVETKSQSEFLKQIECDEIQGYFYGKPMAEEDFNKYIESH